MILGIEVLCMLGSYLPQNYILSPGLIFSLSLSYTPNSIFIFRLFYWVIQDGLELTQF